jgi:hypothetical protein
MRWKIESDPYIGQERIIKKFLLFPKEIKNEVRWLEQATYKEEYGVIYPSGEKRWISKYCLSK